MLTAAAAPARKSTPSHYDGYVSHSLVAWLVPAAAGVGHLRGEDMPIFLKDVHGWLLVTKPYTIVGWF